MLYFFQECRHLFRQAIKLHADQLDLSGAFFLHFVEVGLKQPELQGLCSPTTKEAACLLWGSIQCPGCSMSTLIWLLGSLNGSQPCVSSRNCSATAPCMYFACLVELHLTHTQISVHPRTWGVWRSISSDPSSLRVIPENSSCLMSCFSLLTSDLCLLNSSTQWLLGIGTSVSFPGQCRDPGDNRAHLMWFPFLRDHCLCCQIHRPKIAASFFSTFLVVYGKRVSLAPLCLKAKVCCFFF